MQSQHRLRNANDMTGLSSAQLKKIKMPWRLAPGCALVESIVTFYSSCFRKSFLHDECLDNLWQWIATNKFPKTSVVEMQRRIWTLLDSIESKGYNFGHLGMLDGFFDEIRHNNGNGVLSAIEYAACSYYALVCYRHNLSPGDGRAIEKGGQSIVEELVFDIAISLYADIASVSAADLRTHCLSRIKLPSPSDDSLLPQQLVSIMRTPTKGYVPPIHEAALKQRRRK